MTKFELRGQAKSGFNLSDKQIQEIQKFASNYPKSEWILTISPPTRMKTNKQLGYLYGAVYKSIQDFLLREIREKIDISKIDHIFKTAFFSEKFTLGDNEYTSPKSLADATQEEVANYIDTILKVVALPPKTEYTPDGHELGLGLYIQTAEEYYTQ